MRWPHQSWRLTFQSRMFSSQWKKTFSKRAGRMRTRPSRTEAIAFAAIGLVRMNHCVLRRGSTDVVRALAAADDHLVRPRPLQVAPRLEVAQDRLACLVTVEPRVRGPRPR